MITAEYIYGEGFTSRKDFVDSLLHYCLTESDYKNKKSGYSKLINRIADLKEKLATANDLNKKLGHALDKSMENYKKVVGQSIVEKQDELLEEIDKVLKSLD